MRNCKIKLLACESLNVEPEPERDRHREIVRGETNKHESCFYKPRQKEGKITQQIQTQEKTTHSHTFSQKLYEICEIIKAQKGE